jgi:hypothetical protein
LSMFLRTVDMVAISGVTYAGLVEAPRAGRSRRRTLGISGVTYAGLVDDRADP